MPATRRASETTQTREREIFCCRVSYSARSRAAHETGVASARRRASDLTRPSSRRGRCGPPARSPLVGALTQGFNDIGYSSNDLSGLTPTIEDLAAGGVKLGLYYGQQLCTPARGALLTGKYPMHIGLHHDVIHADAPWGLPRHHAIMPQALSPLGYRSHMVGKWHLGHFEDSYLPTARGFESYFGYLSDTVTYFEHKYPYAFDGVYFNDMIEQTIRPSRRSASAYVRTADEAAPPATATSWDGDREEEASEPIGSGANYTLVDNVGETGEYTASLFTARAVDIIAAHSRDHLGGGFDDDSAADDGAAVPNGAANATSYDGAPLFLYMSYQNVHSPLTPTPPDAWFSPSERKMLKNIDADDRKYLGKALIMLDHAIENVTRALRAHGLYDDAILVYSGDNGGCPQFGAFNYPLRGMKNFMFEGGLRVHGWVHSNLLPRETRGATYGGLMHITDWLPTLLSAAGASELIPSDLDGVDQWAAITGARASSRQLSTAGGAMTSEEFARAVQEGHGGYDNAHNSPRTEMLYNIDPYSEEMVFLDADCGAPCGFATVLVNNPDGARAALRVGKWKLIRHEICVSYFNPKQELAAPAGCSMSSCSMVGTAQNSSDFLFDLVADPFETTNLHANEPEVVQKLSARLDELHKTIVPTEWKSSDTRAYSRWAETGYITPWCSS